jgi:Family of unknown function (DUF6151)
MHEHRTMSHALSCRCGTLKGIVGNASRANHCVCYCKDCQAFARFLGREAEILDAQGGTAVIQTFPANVSFTAGREALACMRLSERGLLRWYSSCCNTPVGNTLANYRVSFVSLIHSCLETTGQSVDHAFGPVRLRVNTKNATGAVQSSRVATISVLSRVAAALIGARLTGSYKHTPFFSGDTGSPVVTPTVLSRGEREKLTNAA